MKDPFKAFTIAITGDFGHDRTCEKMRQWIQVNGGTFSSDINQNVTHLICSKEHFKRNGKLVKLARQLQTIKIVSFDWLEDSLIKMCPRSERDYFLGANFKARKETQKKKKAVREENIRKGMETFEKACKEFEKEMHSSNYSIYHDYANYKYDITLARVDLLTNTNERHVLKLYESNSMPKLYACFEKYSKPGEDAIARILAPVGSSFDVAFDHFKKFFKLKTWKEWEERLQKTVSPESAFIFTPPKGGEARGVVQNDGHLMTVGERGHNIVDLSRDKLEGAGLSEGMFLMAVQDAMDELVF